MRQLLIMFLFLVSCSAQAAHPKHTRLGPAHGHQAQKAVAAGLS